MNLVLCQLDRCWHNNWVCDKEVYVLRKVRLRSFDDINTVNLTNKSVDCDFCCHITFFSKRLIQFQHVVVTWSTHTDSSTSRNFLVVKNLLYCEELLISVCVCYCNILNNVCCWGTCYQFRDTVCINLWNDNLINLTGKSCAGCHNSHCVIFTLLVDCECERTVFRKCHFLYFIVKLCRCTITVRTCQSVVVHFCCWYGIYLYSSNTEPIIGIVYKCCC